MQSYAGVIRPLPVIGQGVLRFAFINAQLFRAALSPRIGEPHADFQMRAAERCTDVTNEVGGESRWRGRANGARASTHGGGEAEIP